MDEVQANRYTAGNEHAEDDEELGAKSVNADGENQTRRHARQTNDDSVPIDFWADGVTTEIGRCPIADDADRRNFAGIFLLELFEAVK